jgi:hypothetical protein
MFRLANTIDLKMNDKTLKYVIDFFCLEGNDKPHDSDNYFFYNTYYYSKL